MPRYLLVKYLLLISKKSIGILQPLQKTKSFVITQIFIFFSSGSQKPLRQLAHLSFFSIWIEIRWYGAFCKGVVVVVIVVPITTKVVSSNPVHGKVYSIQHYEIKFVSDLRQVSGFLRVLRFPPPIKLTATI